jgi:ribosome-associated protein
MKQLTVIVNEALEEVKGKNIITLDVTDISAVMDTVIVVSGSTNRQVKALSNAVIEASKKAGFQPLGVEGMDGGEWVLVDLIDVVVHIMQPAIRDFYELEKLWSVRPNDTIVDN